MLVESGKNGATLDAPKGRALVGDTLWVADINHVRAFNRRTGAKIADIDLSSQHATFLNDVAVGGDGALYVTDTGILFDAKGGMSHPGIDQIFKIEGRKVTALKPIPCLRRMALRRDASNGRLLRAIQRHRRSNLEAGRQGDRDARDRTGPVRRDRAAVGWPDSRDELGGQRSARCAGGRDVETRPERRRTGGHWRRHQARSCRDPAIQR
jgi:hypothetical protein